MIYITKGIYFWFYCRRSFYLYMPQDVCFYFAKKKFCCCYSYNCKSPGKSWKSPGTVKKVCESPGIWINFFGGNHDFAESYVFCFLDHSLPVVISIFLLTDCWACCSIKLISCRNFWSTFRCRHKFKCSFLRVLLTHLFLLTPILPPENRKP